MTAHPYNPPETADKYHLTASCCEGTIRPGTAITSGYAVIQGGIGVALTWSRKYYATKRQPLIRCRLDHSSNDLDTIRRQQGTA